MSQTEIRDKIKIVSGVIEEKKPTEQKIVEPTEAENISEEVPEEEAIEEIDFAVIFKGKRVNLTDEQKARILEIILE